MTLHAKARDDGLDVQCLSINPLYDREGDGLDGPCKRAQYASIGERRKRRNRMRRPYRFPTDRL